MQERKAIVFNCQFNGLSIIRALGRSGIGVLALDTYESVGTKSKYAEYLKCPDPAVDEEAFVGFLIDLGKTFKEKPVIFPTNDIWVLVASKSYRELERYYHLCFSEFDTVNMILSKKEFHQWAVSKAISVPGTWRYNQIDEIDDSQFPVIIKPENRRPLGAEPGVFKKLDSNRMTVVNNKDELAAHFKDNEDISRHLIVQEYVRGMSDSMYTVGIYAKSGRVRAVFTGRKVRGYPADYGDCVLGQIEHISDNIVNEVIKMCHELKYTGIAEFEYKRDSESGRFRLIEINPRSWSWVGITPACGVNLPLIAYKDLNESYIGPEMLLSDKPDGSVKYVKFIEDMKNSLFMYKRKGCSDWHRSFFSWIRSLRCKKLVVAECDGWDIRPLFFTIAKMIARLRKNDVKTKNK